MVCWNLPRLEQHPIKPVVKTIYGGGDEHGLFAVTRKECLGEMWTKPFVGVNRNHLR
jgi:hypothetical protein